MTDPATTDLIEKIGELADKASNYSEYAPETNPGFNLPPSMRADALGRGMVEIRNELVELLVALGGEKPWWAELQP